MREFYVCIVYIAGIKTAIIADKEKVLGVVGDEDMSHTDLLRAYSHYLREYSQDCTIYTNHSLIKYRKLHTSDFKFSYLYRSFSIYRQKYLMELGYQWIDEQDKKLKTGEFTSEIRPKTK